MIYQTIVEKDETGLNLILEAAKKFEMDNYLSALQSCRMNIRDVLRMTNDVKRFRLKLSNEHLALAEFSLVFNNQYATKNNSCFSVAESIFYKIRGTVSGSKKIYKKFSKTMRRKPTLREQEVNCSVFCLSELAKQHQSGHLFGFDSYDVCVENLYLELEGFFMELIKCLALCRYVINDEKNIKGNYERCKKIYQECFDNIVDNSRYIIQIYKNSAIPVPEDEMAVRKSKARSMEEFICENFHKYDTAQFTNHVVASVIAQGKNDGLDEVESLLWPENHEKVKAVRIVIAHFDELDPEGQKGKLDANAVAYVMLWSGIGEGNDGKVKKFVMEYFAKNYHGKYGMLKTNSINTAKNHILYNNSGDDRMVFENKINNLVSKYMS